MAYKCKQEGGQMLAVSVGMYNLHYCNVRGTQKWIWILLHQVLREYSPPPPPLLSRRAL